MLLKDNRQRALKGFLYNSLVDSKVLYVIAGSILLGYLVLTALVSVLAVTYGGNNNSNGGSLNTGFMTAFICMFVSAIVMATGKEKKNHFVFPIDRLTYTAGNLIMFAINTAGLLMLSTAAFVVEILTFRILTRIFDRIIYTNAVDFESYFLGLWVSFWYILLFTTFTYFIFMIFSKFKLAGVISISLVMIILLYFSFGRTLLLSSMQFFVNEQSPVLLSLKLIAFTLIMQSLSFLPLKNMEVNV